MLMSQMQRTAWFSAERHQPVEDKSRISCWSLTFQQKLIHHSIFQGVQLVQYCNHTSNHLIYQFHTFSGPSWPSLTALAMMVRNVENKKSCWVWTKDNPRRPHTHPNMGAKWPYNCSCVSSSSWRIREHIDHRHFKLLYRGKHGTEEMGWYSTMSLKYRIQGGC